MPPPGFVELKLEADAGAKPNRRTAPTLNNIFEKRRIIPTRVKENYFCIGAMLLTRSSTFNPAN